MYTAFSTALSSLNATSTAIDVVGNNLANLNTTGFKASEVSFYDLMSQSAGGSFTGTQVGMGTAPPITVKEFAQGAVQANANPLSAAIQGNGFFMVTNSSNQTLYTRDGDFTLDKNGNLVTNTGEQVQGWTADAKGVLNTGGTPGAIQIPGGQLLAPQPSTQFSLAMNLNAGATAGSANGSFSTPIQAIDSLGNPVNLTVTFTKDATTPNQWNYQVYIPGDATTAGKAGTPTALLTTPGSLTFGTDGALTKPAAANGQIAVSITGLSDNAAALPLTFNLYGANGPTITQYAQASSVSASTVDGQAAAQLTGVGMSDGGLITAQYSNGKQITIAELAMASIQNPGSLVSVGNNNFEVTGNSAPPVAGVANTGGRGQIMGGSLEASNADIATEFTNLITYQRAYEASSKIVTTVDQLSQDTINLMR